MPTLIQKDGLSIYYKLAGNPNASETVLLIGGLTRDHTIWRKIIPELENDYRLLLPDNRDAGQSSHASAQYAIFDMAEDIAAVIKHLSLDAIHLVGHSMGGFMAMYLAANHSALIKTVTLCSTAEKQTLEGINYLKERIQTIDNNVEMKDALPKEADILAVMDKIYAKKTLLNKNFVDEIIQFESSNPYPQPIDAFKRQATACLNHNAEHLLQYINCPVLLLTGEKDKSFPPEVMCKLEAKLHNTTIKSIPSAAHMIQLEQPGLFVKALKNFIISNSSCGL